MIDYSKYIVKARSDVRDITDNEQFSASQSIEFWKILNNEMQTIFRKRADDFDNIVHLEYNLLTNVDIERTIKYGAYCEY